MITKCRIQNTIFSICFTVVMLFTGVQTSYAQDIKKNNKPFVLGVIDSIESTVLKEKRIVNIYLPDEYEQDTTHYPVIYLLDGSADEDFIHIVGLVQFQVMIGAMPPTIVIGIANVDRKRDFTFPTTNKKDKEDYPTTGGSGNFIEFIGKELEPFVKNKYRINENSTIIGQSLGGLVATEILLKYPELFNNYIIVSPSLWWDDESLLHAAPDLIGSHTYNRNRIYVSVGNEGHTMENDAARLIEIIEEAKIKSLLVDFVSLPEEDHATILHNAVYKALLLQNKK